MNRQGSREGGWGFECTKARGSVRGPPACNRFASDDTLSVHDRDQLEPVQRAVHFPPPRFLCGIANALGVNYQTIGYLDRGEYNPSLDLALKAAEYFGLPVEAIFSRHPFAPMSEQLYAPHNRAGEHP